MNNNTNNSIAKQKNKKRQFNIIDFLVILIVVAIVAVSVYSVFSWSDIKKLWSTRTVELDYTVELKGVDQEFIDKIKIDDVVTDGATKNKLGKVKGVDNNEKYWVVDYKKEPIIGENGEPTSEYHYAFTKAEHPDKYNLTVYISTPAEYEEGIGYTVNGKRIAVGEAVDMRFPEFSKSGYCVSIDERKYEK